MKKLHWLQTRITFYALDHGYNNLDENFIKVAEHPINTEDDIAALTKRYAGLSYVIQTRTFFEGAQATN